MVWQILLSRKLVSAPVNSIEYRTFEQDTADLSDRQIKHGMSACKDFVGFFTFPVFRELCQPSAESFGLPDVHKAYIEAAMSDGMRDRVKWSHAAVYHAGRETGWHNLRTSTEKEIYPLFRRNYEEVCRRIIAGEDLSLPIQKALPETVFTPASEEKAKESLSKLREMLG
jgi:hypothetical protein